MHKKRILIFDTEVAGHHVEYLHHLLIKARNSQDEYIFCVSEDFVNVKGTEFDWNYGNNVIFKYVNTDKANEEVSMLKKAYRKSKLLHSVIKSCDVTHIFLVSLITFIPFLPLFVPSKTKVSGIIYNIYLYRWKKSSKLLKILDVLKYIVLSYSRCIDRVYILNDAASARVLNRIYKTRKYQFLIDPYVPLQDKKESLTAYNWDFSNKNVFFHFGAMTDRKGTLEILESLDLISTEICSNSIFIFAGKVGNDIKDDFYKLVNRYQGKTNLIVLDKFCSYGLIAAISKKANLLLMPYKVNTQSSGIIGYASQFNTPVLASAEGLIGKLVSKYKLGYTINEISPKAIAKFINQWEGKNKSIPKDYIEVNTVSRFLEMIEFC